MTKQFFEIHGTHLEFEILPQIMEVDRFNYWALVCYQ